MPESTLDCEFVTFIDRELIKLADDVTEKLPLTDIERVDTAEFDAIEVEVGVIERIEVLLENLEKEETDVSVCDPEVDPVNE